MFKKKQAAPFYSPNEDSRETREIIMVDDDKKSCVVTLTITFTAITIILVTAAAKYALDHNFISKATYELIVFGPF